MTQVREAKKITRDHPATIKGKARGVVRGFILKIFRFFFFSLLSDKPEAYLLLEDRELIEILAMLARHNPEIFDIRCSAKLLYVLDLTMKYPFL